MPALRLPSRAILAVAGVEATPFLQSLITNDINRASETEAVYAALLTAQGKYLFDFFILRHGDGYLLDVEAVRKQALVERLNFYKLRAAVTVQDASHLWSVWAFFGSDSVSQDARMQGTMVFPDPRCTAAGWRAFVPAKEARQETGAFADYEQVRLMLGLADGSRDMDVEQRFILEANFAELHGVDFKKGCYIGQEMTARMAHRGVLKKRIMPVRVEGLLPAPHTPLWSGTHQAGHMLSGQGAIALALVRLEHWRAPLVAANGVSLVPCPAKWLEDVLNKR